MEYLSALLIGHVFLRTDIESVCTAQTFQFLESTIQFTTSPFFTLSVDVPYQMRLISPMLPFTIMRANERPGCDRLFMLFDFIHSFADNHTHPPINDWIFIFYDCHLIGLLDHCGLRRQHGIRVVYWLWIWKQSEIIGFCTVCAVFILNNDNFVHLSLTTYADFPFIFPSVLVT